MSEHVSVCSFISQSLLSLVLQLSSGSTTSLPTLKKYQELHRASSRSPKPHPLEKKRTKGRARRPSSAGAPPLIQRVGDKMVVAVVAAPRVEPGASGWEYCSLPVATEMADCLAGK